ncbi:MAG: NADH-quinone oxidoreductase subunit C [Deltaproteobacteria bacterium]|nr:NADH-quinone oxidoreductase subunit C [Deltaproteobacteria bacterium]
MQLLSLKRYHQRYRITQNEEGSYELQDPFELPGFLALCRVDPDMRLDQLMDIYCVDLGDSLRLHYILRSYKLNAELKLTALLPESNHMLSLSHLYQNANWLERECYDLFGVFFEGHPYLKRLILYPEFAGHPLRKAYPINKSQPLVPIYA